MDVGDGHLVTVKTAGSTGVSVGDRIRLAVDAAEAKLFDKDGLAMAPKQRRS